MPERIPTTPGGVSTHRMRLVIHIGTHKTATTLVQATLARHRAYLREHGLWYPAYPEVLPGVPGHNAHLDLAKGLMSESAKLSPAQVAKFFEVLHATAAGSGDVDTVLLSAEPFYRGKADTEGPYWRQRARYIRDLRALIPFADVEVVIVLRRQDDYLESLYNEHIKATRYSGDIWEFFDDYRSRFQYRQQIAAWLEQFPVVKVATFEDLVGARSVTGRFLEAAVERPGLQIEDVTEKRNTSLPIDLLEFKRYLNGTSLSRPKLASLIPVLRAVAEARGDPGRERRSRLTETDCRTVLAEFADDNRWINDRFFASRPEGLFPSEIRPRRWVEPLDVPACAGIAAELLDRGGWSTPRPVAPKPDPADPAAGAGTLGGLARLWRRRAGRAGPG